MEVRIVASVVPLSALARFIGGATYEAEKLSGAHNEHDVSVIDSKFMRIHRSQCKDCQSALSAREKKIMGYFSQKIRFPLPHPPPPYPPISECGGVEGFSPPQI